jgi:L-rhamnose-H+ transport protein
MNLGFDFGAAVTEQAKALGADPLWAPNLLWLIVMAFGFLANGLYCGLLLWSRRTWGHFLDSQSGANLGLALLMAIIWEGNLIAYAVGADKIGTAGTSAGWAAILSVAVITSNLWGVVAGEWQGVGKRAAAIMVSGVALLVVAVAILAWASSQIPTSN